MVVTTQKYYTTADIAKQAALGNMIKYQTGTIIVSTPSSAQAAYNLQMQKAAQTKAFLANRNTLANTVNAMGMTHSGQKAVVTIPNSSNMNWSTSYTNYSNPNYPLTAKEQASVQKGIVLVKSGSGLNLLLPVGANYLNTTANSGLPQTTANSSSLIYNVAPTQPTSITNTNSYAITSNPPSGNTTWNAGTMTSNPEIGSNVTLGNPTQGNFTMDLSATPVDNSVQTTDLGGDEQHQQTDNSLGLFDPFQVPNYNENKPLSHDQPNFFGLSLKTIAIVGVGLTAIFLLRGKNK